MDIEIIGNTEDSDLSKSDTSEFENVQIRNTNMTRI